MSTHNVTNNTEKEEQPVLVQVQWKPTLRRALRVAASKRGMSNSAVLEAAFREYLEKRGEPTEVEAIEDEE